MHRNTLVASLLLLTIFFSITVARSTPQPLTKSELLALVAGEILPENVAFDIRSRGLDFTPDAAYKALLKTAGAEPKVFAALDAAKTSTGETANSANVQLLLRLSHAGALIKSKQYDEAADELTDALARTSSKSDVGFVMGMVLIGQERFDEATQVYNQILTETPGFPEVHARLSLTYLNTGQLDEGLRQAKAAIAENADNPVAHLNAGAALARMHHPDAAREEYIKSMHCKPDYAVAYSNLAGLFADREQFDAAIEQYKKALALDPNNATTHYNLGVAYDGKGEYSAAIREYREVKHLNSKMLEARQNLAHDLLASDLGAGIAEFRELERDAPDWPLCHTCLGSALADAGRFPEAEKELQIAVRLDPGSAGPLYNLGRAYEMEKKTEQALALYRQAEQLDPADPYSVGGAARILMGKKDFAGAVSDLKRAVEADPANADEHALLGDALQGSGNFKAALAEFKETVSLDAKNLHARLALAGALEKSGDWIGALQNYHQAALDEPPLNPGGGPQTWYNAQQDYSEAQQRFQQHLADLRSSGKSSEAAALEANFKTKLGAASLDDQFHEAMQTSIQSDADKRFDAAETAAKQAIAIAEKIQPMDGRLPEAVGQLGNVYGFRAQYTDAAAAYNRQIALLQKLYGADSPTLATPLQTLGMMAFFQNDLAGAEAQFHKALDLNLKAYGENSNQVVSSLSGLARVYITQKNYAKAEAVMQRAVKIDETIYGADSMNTVLPLAGLCQIYDTSADAAKGASCHARIVSIQEKQFGADSPYLVHELTAEAAALRKLGRNEEAAKIERRTQTLQSADANPN